MSQLDIPDLDEHQLLCFFGRNKTEMSCMDKPQSFLNKLRDNKFILEERYEEMIRIKSIEKRKQSIYKLLDWIEKERPRRIRMFWTCVFSESIMTQYPTLKRLRDSLRDGSFQFSDGEDSDKRGSFCDRDDQQGHSSSPATPVFGPLLNGGNAEIWTWGLFRHSLPVACGDQQGMLYRPKLAKGEPCILNRMKWYTPSEFEELGGNHSSRNWKKSIHCKGTKLEELLKNGHLKCPGYKKSKAKKSTLPCSSNTGAGSVEAVVPRKRAAGSGAPAGDNRGQQSLSPPCRDPGDHLEEVTDERPRVGQNVFRVICGALSGMLHESRFASGRCGKSIRTEDRWLSPVEFVEQGSAAPHARWRRDIQWEGQPLSSLIERKMLSLHPLSQCRCHLCNPDPQAQEGQKNDDDCFVCGSEGNLVMCDHCPRSFHPECHLPRLDPSTLGDNTAWMCTFCIWNMNEYLSQMTHEETLMHPVSNHMLQCHYLLLSLYNADKDHIFAKDPCIHVRGYSSQIVTPMWLDKITEQLLDQQYTVGQLLTHIQLIFSNCDKFNQNKPEYRDMGIKLKEFYEQEVEKVFRSH